MFKRIFSIKFFFATSIFLSLSLAVFAADFSGVGGRPASQEDLPKGAADVIIKDTEGEADTFPMKLERNFEVENSDNWFLFTLNPGETKHDVLLVQNSSDKPVDLLLYPADSVRSSGGGFALKQYVEPREFIGKWVTLSESEFHLEPFESKLVPFKITLPAEEKIDVGEHTGGILIQKVLPEPEQKGGIQLLTRVGVRIYVTVPGEIIEKLELSEVGAELASDGKTYSVFAVIKNEGNTSHHIDVDFKISNVSNPLLTAVFKDLKAFPIENSKKLQVLRDDAFVANFEFPKPLWGKLKLEASVKYKDGTKTLESDPVIIKVPIDRNLLILLIFVSTFIVAVLGLLILRRSRKKNKDLKKKGAKKK